MADMSPAVESTLARVLSVLLAPLRLADRLAVAFFLMLIAGYRTFISPVMRPCCRFTPTCSEYSAESLRRHGLVKGLLKTIYRLGRCHPFCEGGYDPP